MTKKQIILGAHFPGEKQVAWRHPDTRDLVEIDAFIDNAIAAEKANFHFMFLAETLCLVEDKDGQVLAHQLNGRPDSIGVQAVLAGVTERVGFVHTLNTTYNEPYELAREMASLDVLSGGRVAWNIVTSQPPATTRNFTRGDYLPYADRYTRGQEVRDALIGFWPGVAAGKVSVRGRHLSVEGTPTWPLPGQPDRPLILQASASDDGYRFGARNADGIYLIPHDIEEARRNYARIHSFLPENGRADDDLKVIAGLRFVVGDTDEDAEEKFQHYLDLEFTDADVVAEIENVWQMDLPGLDPDGPLPQIEPDYERLGAFLAKGPGRSIRDPHQFVANWRRIAAERGLSNRALVRTLTVRPAIVGTPDSIADSIEEWVDTKAADGFIVQPQVVPGGLIEFAERVVPVLQERGLFRTESPRQTLREAWAAA